jgi:hypothetical protein
MSPELNFNSMSGQLLFSTVRIETVTDTGSGSGTGFIYQVPAGDDQSVPVLVTNKHVLARANQIRFFLHEADHERGVPILGSRLNVAVNIDEEGRSWIYEHPDEDIDIAIAPIAFLLNKILADGKFPYYKAIPPEYIPSSDAIADIDAIESIIMIGYPNGLFDQKNLTPIVRTGAMATPIQLDYAGLPAFLIDASVFPCSSGSPVFLYNPTQHRLANGTVVMGSRTFLLGVVAAVHVRQQSMDIREAVATTQYVQSEEAIDLGLVFRSECIEQVVDVLLEDRGLAKS